MSGALRPAAGAITFLTRAPLGRLVRVDGDDVARGAWLFPVVGGAVGGACGLLADVTAAWLPSLAAGGLAVAAAALLTGAMHLDALADTADALGAEDRERALEVMRDHAIGAFGATALVVVCLLDAAVLGTLAASGDAALVALAAGALGRAAMLPQAYVIPYARAGEGQGRLLTGIPLTTVTLGLVLGILLALPAGMASLGAIAAGAISTVVISIVAERRFGGVTGDVLGATAKVTETAALLAAVAVVT